MRRYDEVIDVRTTPEAEATAGGPPAPEAFVWRDRLYVVRGVLAHWYERRVWWRVAAASALLGLRAVESSSVGQAVGPVGLDGGRPVPPGRTGPLESAERQVWRVEAAAGRSSPVGVYDLVHDPVPDPDQRASERSGRELVPAAGWRLVGVDD